MHKPLKQGKVAAHQLEGLFSFLRSQGYQLIGPRLDEHCITYGELQELTDLPQGWTDFQEKGIYRLKKREDNAYFGYNIGARSFKNFLFPPREKIAEITQNGTFHAISVTKPQKLALIGVRSCELHAIHIQDKVFQEGKYIDNHYLERRKHAFIVTLNCHTAANTCFCPSMNTGPEVTLAFDINLSEIINDTEHYFIVEAGSQKGLEAFNYLTFEEVTSDDIKHKKAMIANTISLITRHLDQTNIKEKLYQNHHHPHWDKVAERCINCGNCTSACPTCFCSRIEDASDLEQKTASRSKVWDSCFSQELTVVHGSYVRDSAKSRYRQWLTHKLGSWFDQFDTSGCVGCGRCITWCPVGIDITEEFAAITASDGI